MLSCSAHLAMVLQKTLNPLEMSRLAMSCKHSCFTVRKIRRPVMPMSKWHWCDRWIQKCQSSSACPKCARNHLDHLISAQDFHKVRMYRIHIPSQTNHYITSHCQTVDPNIVSFFIFTIWCLLSYCCFLRVRCEGDLWKGPIDAAQRTATTNLLQGYSRWGAERGSRPR